MKCSRCGDNESTTNGVIAFTKPLKAEIGKIPEDVSGEFCEYCTDYYFGRYAVIYRPADISRAEALRP